MKKRVIIIAAVVIMALLIGVIAGLMHHRDTYTAIGGQQYLRGTESLKITVTTDEELQ